MSKETVTTPARSVEEMIGKSGRVRRFRPEPETQARTYRNGNAVDLSTDIPDTLAPAGDVDEQIALNEASMREIIGAPIEADDVSVHTLHSTPNLDGDAPDLAAIPYVEGGVAEPGTPTPTPTDRSGKADVGTASIAPPARATLTESSEPSVQTVLTTDTEPREIIVPTPQTKTTELSADSGDARNDNETASTVPTLDTDPARRTVKQRKSELNEYRRRFMSIPKIEDRKPVFVSRTTRDKLDRIVRLLGERGMSVSGPIENIALRHLETHEADIEHWRKM